MAKNMNMNKDLLVNPVATISEDAESFSVSENSSKTGFKLTLVIPVGLGESMESKDGKMEWTDSGGLVIDRTFNIAGIEHRLCFSGGWKDGKFMGSPKITVRPAISKPETAKKEKAKMF